jgi:hypothetical protein
MLAKEKLPFFFFFENAEKTSLCVIITEHIYMFFYRPFVTFYTCNSLRVSHCPNNPNCHIVTTTNLSSTSKYFVVSDFNQFFTLSSPKSILCQNTWLYFVRKLILQKIFLYQNCYPSQILDFGVIQHATSRLRGGCI